MRRRAFIAGIHEFPLRVAPSYTPHRIKAESAVAAVADAGLEWSAIDGLYDAGESETSLPGLGVAEYLGIRPAVIDTTNVGGSSYELHIGRAKRDIEAGLIDVALVTYGSTLRSESSSGGIPTSIGVRETPAERIERPHGLSLVGSYAMVAARHMHEYGTTPEQLAAVPVSARRHALRNPLAVEGLEALSIRSRAELTVADVLSSRPIADPLRLLDCCLMTDGGGAVVLVSDAVLADCRHPGVEILGAGAAVSFIDADSDLTTSAAAESGRRAFADAGVRPEDIDIAMLYDSFSITVVTQLEDLGFCPKGAGGEYVAGGALDFDSAVGPAVNTDGGGLSSTHPGMRGLFLLIEATRQLRGSSTSQRPGAELAVCNGIGGFLGSRHASGTVILGRAR
ncbi:thiolase C-terminal domain-containing protein [Nocardia wallacei]|uniref:thiolase C-terminal domain-containing protein n=1 Tax=Nocardia wallacei TaxID=480035 RepID=UPI0024537975|nr:acetyl-CoA acetyltransferase [Nocardia wallacei]